MSRKRKAYGAEFKAKLVLEVLKEEKSLNEIASMKYYPKIFRSGKSSFWKT
jgi:hypothetical protein